MTTPDHPASVLQEQVSQILAAHHETGPSILYHYTDSAGLLGIVSSESLWLTNILFMNDGSELHFGLSLINDVVAELAALEADEERALWLERLHLGVALLDLMGIRFFVGSFTEKGDQLSQWRSYGREGFAIGFDLGPIRHLAKPSDLVKVRYERGEQVAAARSVIKAVLDFLEPFDPRPIQTATRGDAATARIAAISARRRAQAEMIRLATAIKHPAFDEEAEWRLVVRAEDTDARISHRALPGLLTPYLDYDLSEVVEASKDPIRGVAFPIRSIVVGPMLDQPLNAMAIEQLVAQNAPDATVEIYASGTPLRR